MFNFFSKVFLIFFIIYPISLNASNDLNIISRSDWGADESYRYLDSPEWKNILEKRKNTVKKDLTQEQKQEILKNRKKTKKANLFLKENYSKYFDVFKIEEYDGENKLAWPIHFSKKKSIIIHHTDTVLTGSISSYDQIRAIYKYHSLTRQWGDIGYNYLIGRNGEIFEGRAGGDSVSGAHDKWNNFSSIGISIIGNYDKEEINEKQYNSLKKLTEFLIKKHSIDMNKKISFFKWCIDDVICDEKPIIVSKDYPIIGHRDAGHTNCPGEELYKQVNKLKYEFYLKSKYENNFLVKKIIKNIAKLDDTKKLILSTKINLILNKNISSKTRDLLEFLKLKI